MAAVRGDGHRGHLAGGTYLSVAAGRGPVLRPGPASGLGRLFPPMRRAWDQLGTVRPTVAAATGLPRIVRCSRGSTTATLPTCRIFWPARLPGLPHHGPLHQSVRVAAAGGFRDPMPSAMIPYRSLRKSGGGAGIGIVRSRYDLDAGLAAALGSVGFGAIIAFGVRAGRGRVRSSDWPAADIRSSIPASAWRWSAAPRRRAVDSPDWARSTACLDLALGVGSPALGLIAGGAGLGTVFCTDRARRCSGRATPFSCAAARVILGGDIGYGRGSAASLGPGIFVREGRCRGLWPVRGALACSETTTAPPGLTRSFPLSRMRTLRLRGSL